MAKKIKKYDGMKYINSIENDNSEATILLYAPIGKFLDANDEVVDGIDGEAFAQSILYLQDKVKRINVRINSGGGSVMEGMKIVAAIQNSAVEIVTYNDFFAASISALILASGHQRFAIDYSTLLIHNPANQESEDDDDELLERFRTSILTIITNNSTLQSEEVSSMMDKETCFSAEEAKSAGLIDIVLGSDNRTFKPISAELHEAGKILNLVHNMKKVTKKIAEVTDVEVVTPIIISTPSIVNEKEKPGMESPESVSNEVEEEQTEGEKGEDTEIKTEEKKADFGRIADCMGLKDDADEEEVYDAVKSLKAKHEDLKADHKVMKDKLDAMAEETKKAHNDKVDAMVNSFITSGAIKKDEFAGFKNLANADFITTESMLNKLSKGAGLKITDTIKSNIKNSSEKSGWTYMDYSKKDAKALEVLKKEAPAEYERLKNEYFNNK